MEIFTAPICERSAYAASKGNKASAARSLGMIVCFVMSFAFNANAIEKKDLPRLDRINSQAIAREIGPEMQKFVDRQKRLPGQGKHVLVRVTPDPATQRIYIDLDATYLPKNRQVMTEDFGKLVGAVEHEAIELLTGIVNFEFVEVRIGGKKIDEIYPPDYLLKDKGNAGAMAVVAPVDGLVVLNPGHGKYYHYGLASWQYQRPEPYAGTTTVFEDTITPGYSSALASLLATRSSGVATDIKHTRDIGNTTIDPASNLPWAALGARYYLKRLYPTLGSTIWNKYPNGTEPARLNLREYDEDIRARPEYANYLNAETFISLHTNAAAPTARGASLYTKINDPRSVALSTNVQCYLKEQVQQLPQYVDYAVAENIESGTSYAEVREAAMPTVLVELGFHTNTVDATALQTSAFRSASMRGIEKGYRMFKAGETVCQPFKIVSIPAASGPFRVRFPVTVNYSGKPRFPVVVETASVNCPAGWTCNKKTTTFSSAIDNKLISYYYCDAASSQAPGSFTWKTTVKDADGVITASVDHVTSCAAATS